MRNAKHLRWIRTLPCATCHKPAPSEASHIRAGTDGGMGLKPSDWFCIPQCRECHAELHRGEKRFWEKNGGIEKALSLSNGLWVRTGDTDQALLMIARFGR